MYIWRVSSKLKSLYESNCYAWFWCPRIHVQCTCTCVWSMKIITHVHVLVCVYEWKVSSSFLLLSAYKFSLLLFVRCWPNGWQPWVQCTYSSPVDITVCFPIQLLLQDASRAGRYPSYVPESTEELLNRSHSLRYGLQVLERERGRSQQPPHTTPYPIL